jgi:hypothetical protein
MTPDKKCRIGIIFDIVLYSKITHYVGKWLPNFFEYFVPFLKMAPKLRTVWQILAFLIDENHSTFLRFLRKITIFNWILFGKFTDPKIRTDPGNKRRKSQCLRSRRFK